MSQWQTSEASSARRRKSYFGLVEGPDAWPQRVEIALDQVGQVPRITKSVAPSSTFEGRI
jgi:hypothetical protein